MHGLGNAAEVWEKYFHARLCFIETELDLASTFCHIAETTEDPNSRARNISNAEKASETAAAFLRDLSFDSGKVVRLRRKLHELEFLILDCKETI